MATVPVGRSTRLLWVWMRVLLLVTGSTGLVCYTVVESLDLGCLLRWDCPHASPNTTYTVQTKTQGDPWQDVSWCVWISSRSCDVSPAFVNFELYNMIRLGVHVSPTATVWIRPRKFDYSDFTFSPPSVSVALKEDELQVTVQFPCAASRRCSQTGCCPISELIDPWTTVTVYNNLNLSESQSRTVWSQEVLYQIEFAGLSPGQNYCAVANFSFPTFSMAASPRSAPECVQTISRVGLLPALVLGVGICSVVFAPLVTMFPHKHRRNARLSSEHQPKTQAADPVPEPTVSLCPVDPTDVQLELTDDLTSTRQDPPTTLEDILIRSQQDPSYWDSDNTSIASSVTHTCYSGGLLSLGRDRNLPLTPAGRNISSS